MEGEITNESNEETLNEEEKPPKDQDEEMDGNEDRTKQPSRQGTTATRNSYETKVRAQILAELEKVRGEMVRAASAMKKPKLKPYSPDIFNSLSPYYNKYLVDYVIKDQDPIYHPWGSYGQRQTALGIVVPEMSLKMDSFPLPAIASKVPGQLYKMKIWSKNFSGKDSDLGSTRLPSIPPLALTKLTNPEYQHFSMTYQEVPKFREDVRKMYTALDEKRKKSDYDRVQKDWKRMNLDEMKELPERSRYHYSKAITTYLGTSKGSLKAVHSLGHSLNASPEQS